MRASYFSDSLSEQCYRRIVVVSRIEFSLVLETLKRRLGL